MKPPLVSLCVEAVEKPPLWTKVIFLLNGEMGTDFPRMGFFYSFVMPTKMKTLLALLALVLSPVAAEACRCRGSKPPTEVLISSHSLIFIGHATSSKLILGSRGRYDAYTEFTFTPIEIYKGNSKLKEIKMLSYGTSCDIIFHLGVDYTIYAKEAGTAGAFHAGTCDYPKFLPFADVEEEQEKVREAVRTIKAAKKSTQ